MVEAALVNRTFPRYGDTTVDDVKPRDVRAVVKKIEARQRPLDRLSADQQVREPVLKPLKRRPVGHRQHSPRMNPVSASV